MSTPPPGLPALAGGTAGPDALRPLLAVVLDALRDGAADRGGPLPSGGPDAVAARVREAVEPVLPDHGTGADEALRTLVRTFAHGAADPADPLCAAHLHTSPSRSPSPPISPRPRSTRPWTPGTRPRPRPRWRPW